VSYLRHVEMQAVPGSAASSPVCVIDFANYPFIRRFAGHLHRQRSCTYLYHPGFQSPNQGQREHQPWEYPVDIGGTFAKQNLIKRWFQERTWGIVASGVLDTLGPSLVIVANAPLEVVSVIQKWCHAHGTPFVFWLQDVHSYAIAEALGRRFPVLASPVVSHYRRLERRLLRDSQRVLLIADEHRAVLDDLQTPSDRARVLLNWSTIEDFPEDATGPEFLQKEQVWRAEHGLVGKRLLTYSGTLGMKHDPGLLADLAEACAGDLSVAVVVISSGPGADWLKSQASERGLSNLHVLPFVDYPLIATTLGAAEILLAILEPAAARFSVPSKILTYACAGRPVVVAMPTDNAAARLVRDVEFGIVAPSGDSAAFIDAVRSLLEQPERAVELGQRGRAYAEANFPMPIIEKRFVASLAGLVPW
jgi:colanic acid biosynthesis glycosyl transferase WcaI